MFVDSHAHIDGPEYDADRDEVIQSAQDAGVSAILNVGTGDPHGDAFERAVGLASRHPNIWAAIGVHPHDAKLYDASVEAKIKNLIAENARVIAWGEIGLDYHYDNSPRETQRDVFRQQLRAARDCDLPVIIHTREADDDTIEILQSDYGAQTRGGIMHCFGGSPRLAQAALELGFYVSFSGNITFKKADDIRGVSQEIPRERLLIETDCPYLSPVPFRGRRNEPAHVVEVARCLADLRNVSLEEIAAATTNNFRAIFRLEQISNL